MSASPLDESGTAAGWVPVTGALAGGRTLLHRDTAAAFAQDRSVTCKRPDAWGHRTGPQLTGRYNGLPRPRS